MNITDAITEATFGYAETRSFGDHHNVTPQMSLTAQVHGNWGETIAQLTNECMHWVRSTIDHTLEDNHQPPYYWKGPRWDALYSYRRKAIIVIPHNADAPIDFNPIDAVPQGMAIVMALIEAHDVARAHQWQVYTDSPYSPPPENHPLSGLITHPLDDLPPLQLDPAQPAGDDDAFDEEDEPYYDGEDDEDDNTVITMPNEFSNGRPAILQTDTTQE
ncbi:MAG TPA: hypothetical protein VMX14_13310 [Anaerolineae bacterium]|nr:hypothetical protein [Anaerolineae bacterium]